MKHNWEYKRLGDVCKIVNGFAFKSELFKDSGMPILRIANIQNDTITTDALVFCNPSDYKTDLSKFLVKSDDLVMALSGATTGKIGINKTNIEFYLNQRVALFKDILISRRYLFYFLKTEGKNILESAFGVAQPNVSTSKLTELYIPVPPLNVQEQIVAELDKINETIEDCRELLCNLDALAQSLFYDTFGNPITNPKGWEVKKLSDECLDVVDGDHSAPPKTDKGVPFITISNIDKTRNSIDFSDTFFVPQSYYDGLKDNRKARNGDVLYTVTGSYGVTVLIENLPKFCFQRHIGLIRPKATLNSVFLSYWGRSASIKAYADTVATGIAQKTVSLKSLRDFPIILPPLSLQEQFAARIEQIEAQKKAVEQTIAELQTLLDSRMDYWFN